MNGPDRKAETRAHEVTATDLGGNVEVAASGPQGAIRATADVAWVVVTGGGAPPDEVLAAVAVALGAVAADTRPVVDQRPPAWARAALLEGVGERIMVAPGHLDVPAPGGGGGRVAEAAVTDPGGGGGP